ncbi:UpxY family transcription antiterminator [Cellulophaga baltica]|uniref:UpxY family transcription antiterminator n=1 Tax=Cellulophaga TaxID=104264 RepID=UPI001C06E643|nr:MULTISPECIES: UpxY family transcription antiterminator [Cellulophaga]MBU2995635.1 UpxY family transcription antiterminator [Cellulophaga baltica]MDO6767029.1 UpxY family transcription antiterminator [Cellulophaga sp. 1_MG-2023]
MNWYVIYVQYRKEKKIAQQLENIGIDVYCPIIKEIKQWSDRKKTIETPLFKSYVFVRLDEKERKRVFDISGVIRYLFWLGKPAIVKDEEINTIKNWLENDTVEEITLSNLIPGDQLLIKNGFLKNHNAIIQEIGKKRMRLIIPGLDIVLNARIKDVV